MSWIFRRPADYRVKPSPIFLLLAVASAASGAAGITITPTGAISGSGALAGSCSIGITGDAVAGLPNLVGSSALTFDATTSQSGAAAAAGVCAIVFGGAGDMGGAQGYPTALRMAQPRRWYPAPYDFTPYQNRIIVMSLATEAGVSGQCDIIFTPIGVLRGTGPLDGAASFAFGGAGLLRGAGTLAGTAAIAITPSGPIVGTASGAITGAVALTLDGLAAPQGTGALLGIAPVLFTLTMVPGSDQPIGGSSAMIFAATGTMDSTASTPSTIRTPRGRTLLVHDRRRR
jgi:hypothetical protein